MKTLIVPKIKKLSFDKINIENNLLNNRECFSSRNYSNNIKNNIIIPSLSNISLKNNNNNNKILNKFTDYTTLNNNIYKQKNILKYTDLKYINREEFFRTIEPLKIKNEQLLFNIQFETQNKLNENKKINKKINVNIDNNNIKEIDNNDYVIYKFQTFNSTPRSRLQSPNSYKLKKYKMKIKNDNNSNNIIDIKLQKTFSSDINNNFENYNRLHNFDINTLNLLNKKQKHLKLNSDNIKSSLNSNSNLNNNFYYIKNNKDKKDYSEFLVKTSDKNFYKKFLNLNENNKLKQKNILNGNKFLNLLSTNFFRKIECFNQKNKNISENYVINLLNQEIFSINKNIDQEIEAFSSIKNFSLLLKQKLNLLNNNNNNNNIYSNNFLCLVPLINKIFSPNFKKIFYNEENINKKEEKKEEEEKTLKNEEFETPIIKRSAYKLKTNLIPFHERKNLEESFYFDSDENESSLDSQELREKNYNEHLKSDLDYFYKPNNLFENGFQILTKKSKKYHSILKKSFSHPNFLIKNLFLPFVKLNFSLFLKEKNKNHKLFQIMCNKILFNKKFISKNNKIIFPILGKNKITSGMLMKDFIIGKTIKNNYIKNLKLKQEINQENEIKNEEKKLKEDFKLFLEKEFQKSNNFLNELQKEIYPFENTRNNQRSKTAKLKSKDNFNFEKDEKKLNLNLNDEFNSSEESINEQVKKEEKKKKIIFKLNSNDENNVSIEKDLINNKLNDNNNNNKNIIDNNKLSNKISPNNSKGKIKSILKNTTKNEKNIQFLNNSKNDIINDNNKNNENVNNKNNENVNNSKKLIKKI